MVGRPGRHGLFQRGDGVGELRGHADRPGERETGEVAPVPLGTGERDDRSHRVPEQHARHAGVLVVHHQVQRVDVVEHRVDAEPPEPADPGALRRPPVAAQVHRPDAEAVAAQRRGQPAVAAGVLRGAVHELDGSADVAVRQPPAIAHAGPVDGLERVQVPGISRHCVSLLSGVCCPGLPVSMTPVNLFVALRPGHPVSIPRPRRNRLTDGARRSSVGATRCQPFRGRRHGFERSDRHSGRRVPTHRRHPGPARPGAAGRPQRSPGGSGRLPLRGGPLRAPVPAVRPG